MKGRIFALAFAVGFVVLFAAAAVLTYRFTEKEAEQKPIPEDEEDFLPVGSAVFLLIFESEGEAGPFSLVALDGENGRVPVFSFPNEAVFFRQREEEIAGELFSRLSRREFAGAVEKEFGIEIAGYFVWDEESAEKILAKTGTFDYVLPEKLSGKIGERKVELAAGVQNMTAQKISDVITFPNQSETKRCDALSRILAAFFDRRLRRFLPKSGDLYKTLTVSTETDVSAFDKERYQDIIAVLVSRNSSVVSKITCDTEKDGEKLFLSEETLSRVKKYFGE